MRGCFDRGFSCEGNFRRARFPTLCLGFVRNFSCVPEASQSRSILFLPLCPPPRHLASTPSWVAVGRVQRKRAFVLGQGRAAEKPSCGEVDVCLGCGIRLGMGVPLGPPLGEPFVLSSLSCLRLWGGAGARDRSGNRAEQKGPLRGWCRDRGCRGTGTSK